MKRHDGSDTQNSLPRRLWISSTTAALAAITVSRAGQAHQATASQLANSVQADDDVTYKWDTSKPFDYGVMHRPDRNTEVVQPHELVTQANFQRPPYSVYFHQHPGHLLRMHSVSSGNTPVVRLPVATANGLVNSVQVDDAHGNSVTFAQHLDNHFTDAIVILHDGVIKFEQYYNGMRPSTLHYLWSVTKTITASVIWNLLEQGKLRREESVGSYVPWLAGMDCGSATIDQLFKMQSGLAWDISPAGVELAIDDPMNMLSDAGYSVECRATGLYPKLPTEPAVFGIHDFMRLQTQVRPHGQVFAYKNPDTFALAEACRAVTGKTIAELTEEMVWSRLGVEHDALYHHDIRGTVFSAGGFAATARDMARFGEMLRNDGRFNDRQIVPQGLLARVLETHQHDKFSEEGPIPRSVLGLDRSYNDFTWIWLRDGLPPAYSANGYQGQLVYVGRATYTP